MVVFFLGFVYGVWLLQQQATLPLLYWLPVIVVSFCLFALSRYFKLPSPLRFGALLVMAVLVGFFYAALFATVRINDALPKAWEQKNIEVIGVIATMSDVSARGERFRFHVEKVLTHDAQVPSHIGLSYYRSGTWHQSVSEEGVLTGVTPAKFHAGERWHLTVRLKRPHTTYNPHGYDFEAWAFAHNVRAMGSIRTKRGMQKLSNFVWRPSYMVEYCREKIGDRISQVLANKPYAGVVRGLVVGDGSQITAQDWDIYLRTGTNHLMSISGLHITMLAGLVFSVITFFWRRHPRLVLFMPTRQAATIGGAFAALLYACLAGLSVPTQRTLYMLMTFAIALMLSRRVPMYRVLAIALMVVVLLDPWAVVAPGFWLSFSAVAVITYATVSRLRVRHWVIEAMNTQWAVTLGLLPFLILMFGQASIVSPIANALAIPVISLLVVPLAILGALLPLDFILHISHSVLGLCMAVLDWLAMPAFATWQQAAAPIWAIVLAILGMLWVLLPRGLPQRWSGAILMLPMLFAATPQLAEGEMKVTVLDVGQGLSVVVQTTKHAMVYDTGQGYNLESDAGSRIVVPYLRSHGIEALDAMMVSHDDGDHSGGFESILSQVSVKWLASSYEMVATKAPIPKQLRCYAGQEWNWDAVQFKVLHPSVESYQDDGIKDNNRSCVIKVTSRHGSVLLTGDVEKEAEQELLKKQRYQLPSDVVIAPHHGSLTSSTEAFVKAVGARHVVFTVGYLNRFKHPKQKVMSRYAIQGATLYRSDHHGGVTLDFRQKSGLSISAERLSDKRYWHDNFL